jgi:hypothetical protein
MSDIEELARHAIRFARIIDDLRMIVHDIQEHMSQLSDRDIFSSSDIEKVSTSIVIEEVEYYLSKIIDIEKLTTS